MFKQLQHTNTQNTIQKSITLRDNKGDYEEIENQKWGVGGEKVR